MAKQEKLKKISFKGLAKDNGVEIPKEETIVPNTDQDNRIPPFLGREKELAELDKFLRNPKKQIFGLFGAPMIGKTELIRQFLKTNAKVKNYQIIKIKLLESDIESPDLTLTNELKKWDKSKATLFVISNFEQTLKWEIVKDLHQIRTEYEEIREFLVEIHGSREHKLILESRFQCNLQDRNVFFSALKDLDLKGVDPEFFWENYAKNGISREDFEKVCVEFNNHTWLLCLGSDPKTIRFMFQNQPKNIALQPQSITEKLWNISQNAVLQHLSKIEDAVICSLIFKSPIDHAEFDANVGQKLLLLKHTNIDEIIQSLFNKFLITDGYEINPFLKQICRIFMQKVRRNVFKQVEKFKFFKDTKKSNDAIRELHRNHSYKVFFNWLKENRNYGKFDEIIEILEKVIWENPKPEIILNEMAITYKYAKKYDKAKEVLKKACELGNLHSFNELGIIYKLEGNLVKAKETFEKAFQLGNTHSLNELGIICKEEGNLAKAKEIFEKAQRLGNIHASNELAIIYKKEGKLIKAKKMFLELIEKHDYILASHELAIIYKEEGKLIKAKKMFLELSEKKHTPALNELAIICKEEGDLAQAKEILEKALKIEPLNVKILNELAIIDQTPDFGNTLKTVEEQLSKKSDKPLKGTKAGVLTEQKKLKNSKNSPEQQLKSLSKAINKLKVQSLNLFCMTHFEQVHNGFMQKQTKISKITALLEYVQSNNLLEKLEKDLAGFEQ